MSGGDGWMKCPRCDSLVSEYMKFCGNCGVEVETGNKTTIDAWINYITSMQETLVDRLHRFSRLNLVGLIVASVSLPFIVVVIPFLSATIALLWLFPFVGAFLGLGIARSAREELRKLKNPMQIYEGTKLAVLSGELTTSKEIIGYLEKQIKKDAGSQSNKMKGARSPS
jgi:hypothetical protein